MTTTEARVPVFHILHNQDVELYYARLREDKIYLNNEKVAQFTNAGVFTIKDTRGKVARKYKALIYLDGKAECVKIPDSEESILEPLTDKDRKNIVKREIAKQLGKFKPMENWMFIILAAIGAFALALQLIGLLT